MLYEMQIFSTYQSFDPSFITVGVLVPCYDTCVDAMILVILLLFLSNVWHLLLIVALLTVHSIILIFKCLNKFVELL